MVHEHFASARPAIVALELPASFRPALEWAASCWPTPVAAFERGRRSAMGTVMPFVPGDSIFEAFRLASQAGIEVALIDVDVSVPGEQVHRARWLSLRSLRHVLATTSSLLLMR